MTGYPDQVLGRYPIAYAATAIGAQLLAIGLAIKFCSWVYGDGASPARSPQSAFPVETSHPHTYYTILNPHKLHESCTNKAATSQLVIA